MTATPITDAAAVTIISSLQSGPESVVPTSVARELERKLTAERDALRGEVAAVIATIPGNVAVREDNGPTNLAASLAVSVARLIAERDRANASRDAEHEAHKMTQYERDAALAKLALARETLEVIAGYDKDSKFGAGICPYGCDTPHIAQEALESTKP
jgi:hypothetical protein